MPKKKSDSGDIQLTLRVSSDLYGVMQQGCRQFESMNEYIRTCIRAYSDETGDLIGSRKHFNASMSARLDELEALVIWNAALTQMLIANNAFTTLDQLSPDAVEDPPSTQEQMAMAIASGKKYLPIAVEQAAPILNALKSHLRERRRGKLPKIAP